MSRHHIVQHTISIRWIITMVCILAKLNRSFNWHFFWSHPVDKKHSQYPPSSVPSRHPRPTAIPILKPQVLGVPHGCYDVHTVTPSCHIHCCADDLYNAYSVQSNIEPESDAGYLKYIDDKVTNNQSFNNSQTKSKISTQTATISTTTSTTHSPATIIINTPASTNRINSPFETHPKFDTSEPNLNKKKRTDKGLSFGKYGGSGIQDIHNINNLHDSKMSILRRRRETRRSTDPPAQNIHTYSRKDLTKTVDSIKLLELNATINYSYCTKLQCTQGIGTKFHYIIPISKYMDQEYVTLQFK